MVFYVLVQYKKMATQVPNYSGPTGVFFLLQEIFVAQLDMYKQRTNRPLEISSSDHFMLVIWCDTFVGFFVHRHQRLQKVVT